jgi:hypothetical protein
MVFCFRDLVEIGGEESPKPLNALIEIVIAQLRHCLILHRGPHIHWTIAAARFSPLRNDNIIETNRGRCLSEVGNFPADERQHH